MSTNSPIRTRIGDVFFAYWRYNQANSFHLMCVIFFLFASNYIIYFYWFTPNLFIFLGKQKPLFLKLLYEGKTGKIKINIVQNEKSVSIHVATHFLSLENQFLEAENK